MAKLDDGEGYLVSRSYLNDDGTPGWRNKHLTSTVRAGRLRITRTGTEVTAWAAEGTGADFKELGRDDLGNDDIKVIWLMAYTGHVAHALDLRLTDLKIRSGIPIPAPPPVEAVLPGRASRPHLWWALAILLALLVVGAASAWHYAHRRSRMSAAQAEKAEQ